MDIGSRRLGAGLPALVVAEIGNNHDGSIRQAEQLIDAAAESGADAVKFQTHIAEAEMLPSTPTPPHFAEPRYAFTQRMELSLDDHLRLKERAEQKGRNCRTDGLPQIGQGGGFSGMTLSKGMARPGVGADRPFLRPR